MTGETISVEETSPLIRFVRETLGCGCPDEVLARIVPEVSPDGERGLDVGGRLMVRVLPGDDVDWLIESFPETVERLQAERERRGFRRLRLVVCRPEPEVLQEILESMLEAMVVADERVYVHVIPPDALPPSLAG